jgi:hypothetical protein
MELPTILNIVAIIMIMMHPFASGNLPGPVKVLQLEGHDLKPISQLLSIDFTEELALFQWQCTCYDGFTHLWLMQKKITLAQAVRKREMVKAILQLVQLNVKRKPNWSAQRNCPSVRTANITTAWNGKTTDLICEHHTNLTSPMSFFGPGSVSAAPFPILIRFPH